VFFLLLCFLCFYCYYVSIDVRLSHLNKDYLLTYLLTLLFVSERHKIKPMIFTRVTHKSIWRRDPSRRGQISSVLREVEVNVETTQAISPCSLSSASIVLRHILIRLVGTTTETTPNILACRVPRTMNCRRHEAASRSDCALVSVSKIHSCSRWVNSPVVCVCVRC